LWWLGIGAPVGSFGGWSRPHRVHIASTRAERRAFKDVDKKHEPRAELPFCLGRPRNVFARDRHHLGGQSSPSSITWRSASSTSWVDARRSNASRK
jgi:hypothetical protein